MNTHLAPGVRKLPSTLDLQILNAIHSSTGWDEAIPALTAPLIGITDGTFDTPDAWETRGGTTLLNGQATLTEESRFLSNLSQTFIIPEGAKYLQFTLVDTNLGTSHLAPSDAFEVALLDAYNLTPLVSTAAGLIQTDSLLNLQHNGQAYFSSQVTLAGAPTSGGQISLNSPRTVKIDISGITPGTLATLYFDLLGFGKRDGSVTIDDVVLLKDGLSAPTAQNEQPSPCDRLSFPSSTSQKLD
uniref:hypothetical protein n=1 Tax=Trichocoleus desertorum TaxID=1481672 RepID=UPI0036F25763